MKFRKQIPSLATKVLVCLFVAGGLALVGCGSEKVESSPMSSSKEVFDSTTNQAAKGGKAIQAKSIKGLIKKDAGKQ